MVSFGIMVLFAPVGKDNAWHSVNIPSHYQITEYSYNATTSASNEKIVYYHSYGSCF